jgi:hypothetical protein
MSWLSKILGYVSREERDGISLDKKPAWEISPPKNFPSFLRALLELVPEESILYIEGNAPEETENYLKERKTEDTFKIAMGTIWPRPEYFHMKITKENIEGLAKIEESHETPIGSIHLHVYKNNKVILSGYDAFLDPFLISKEIPEDKIRSFSNKLGVTYHLSRRTLQELI